MLYRLATNNDIDLLVSLRLRFIEVNDECDNFDIIKCNCYSYFNNALVNNTCDIVLAEDNGECVGTGIVFYYNSVPSTLNVTGKNAYITSMYVAPEYRRKGIATTILKKLIETANEKDYQIIMLNASEMGKPMYTKMGFEEIHNGMLLNIRKD